MSETWGKVKDTVREVTEAEDEEASRMLDRPTEDIQREREENMNWRSTGYGRNRAIQIYGKEVTCNRVCTHLIGDLIKSDSPKRGIMEDITRTAMFSLDQCAAHCENHWGNAIMGCISGATNMKKANKCVRMNREQMDHFTDQLEEMKE